MKTTRYLWIARFAVLAALLLWSPVTGAAPTAGPSAQPAPGASPQRRSRSRAPGAESKNHRTMMHAFRDVVTPVARSTVGIFGDGKQVALGAVVGADGYIVTKASELKGRLQVALHDGPRLPATVVGRDETNDVALLKVPAEGMQPVPWAGATGPAVGSWMVTPGTGEDPVAVGIVSVATRPGGRRVVLPTHGFLGVSLESIDKGARIVEVIPRSAAAAAKLMKEDVILKVDAVSVGSREDLTGYLRKTKPGQKVTLELRRKDKNIKMPVTLGKWSNNSRSARMNEMGGPLSERRTGFSKILQHDGPLAPNQCGGPVVDVHGKVVGINIARAGRIESDALPVEVVQPLVTRLIAQAGAKARAANPVLGPVTTADLEKLYANLAKLEAEASSYLELKGKVRGMSAEIEKALERTQREREALQEALTKARRTLESLKK